MKKEISDALIKKYLDRRCSANEKKMVEAWYESMGDSLSAEELERLRNNQPLKLRMLENIRRHSGLSTGYTDKEVPSTKQKRIGSPAFKILLKTAAAVVLIAFAWVLLQRHLDNLSQTNGLVMIKNEGKTVLKHQLPDGSVLWLSPQSSLQYTNAFQEEVREVAMRGDIFFEVAKDPNKPFVINSGQLRTKVLGTSFRIRAAHEMEEEVSVVSGMVAVSRAKTDLRISEKVAASEEILLTADQKVHFNKNEEQLIKTKETSRSSVKMWKKRNISFEDKPLVAIVGLLDSTFNVRIVFQDKTLENYTLTADFNELNLISIMEIISQSLNLQYEISGDRIRLIKNR